jgi:hypothetical protein
MAIVNSKNQFYSKQGLWSLFLMCAFPLHLWTLILSFRDFSWVAERTNSWDAVGVISYGLLFAFMESLIIFCVMALLGLLINKKWDEPHRIALSSLLVLLVLAWAIYGQACFVWNIPPSAQFLSWIAKSAHPYRYLFGMMLIEVSLTMYIPAFLVLRWDKFFGFIREVIDRLSLLTLFYLAFDVIGLVIIVIRNVF